MAILVGAPVAGNLNTQLTKRRELIGKTSEKTNDDQLYLHAKTGWIKLSSGVNTITDAEIASLRGQSKRTTIKGDNKLAVQNVLVGGVGIGTGIEGRNAGAEPAYRKNNSNGYRPSPGITSMTVKSKNSFGTLREAEVKFSVWSLEDFEIMEKLYLRPGFIMLLEWGHSLYIDNSGALQKTIDTVGDAFFQNGQQLYKIVDRIVEIRDKSSYNYEGMVGFCKNFSWNYTAEGGYECSVSIISTGEVIESAPARLAPGLQIPKDQFSSEESETGKEERKSIFHYFVSRISTITANAFNKDAIQSSETLVSSLQPFEGSYIDVQIDEGLLFDTDTPMHYVPLRVVLDLYNKFIAIKDLTKKSTSNSRTLTKFNTDYSKAAKFLTNAFHFSIDPTVCVLLRPNNDSLGLVKELQDDSEQTRLRGGGAVDDILNIFVTTPFIKLKFDEALDTDGKFNKSFVDILKGILDGISNALGGINDFDMHFDEEDRGGTFHLVDRNLTSDNTAKKIPKLQLAGLDSIFREIDISSNISNETATQMAVAAQGATQNYTENLESMLKWNPGIVDRVIVTKDISSKSKEGDAAVKADNTENLAAWRTDVIDFFSSFQNYDGYQKDELEALKTPHIQYTVEEVTRIPSKGDSGQGIIPVELSFKLDGIGGFRITSVFTVGQGVLPSRYSDKYGMIITGVEHSIGDNNTWETSVMAQIYLIKPPQGRVEKKQEFTKRPDTISRPTIEQLPFNLGGGFGGPMIPFTGDQMAVNSYGMWLYLAWNQGPAGAGTHYTNLTAPGVGEWRFNLGKGTNPRFLRGIKGNLPQGYSAQVGSSVVTRGTGEKAYTNPVVDALFFSNPKALSTAFVEIWQKCYADRLKAGLNNLRTGQTRCGDTYDQIDQLLTQHAAPYEAQGLTAARFKAFATIENAKNSDSATGAKYQGMFQMDNTENLTYMATLRSAKATAPKVNPGFTYYNPNILIPKAAKHIVDNWKSFLDAGKTSSTAFPSP